MFVLDPRMETKAPRNELAHKTKKKAIEQKKIPKFKVAGMIIEELLISSSASDHQFSLRGDLYAIIVGYMLSPAEALGFALEFPGRAVLDRTAAGSTFGEAFCAMISVRNKPAADMIANSCASGIGWLSALKHAIIDGNLAIATQVHAQYWKSRAPYTGYSTRQQFRQYLGSDGLLSVIRNNRKKMLRQVLQWGAPSITADAFIAAVTCGSMWAAKMTLVQGLYWPSLFLAFQKGKLGIAKYIYTAAAKFYGTTSSLWIDDMGLRRLAPAVAGQGNVKLMKYLVHVAIEQGFLHCIHMGYEQLLRNAAAAGHAPMCKYLLSKQFRDDAKQSEVSGEMRVQIMREAVRTNRPGVMRILHEHARHLSLPITGELNSIFVAAAKSGAVQALRLLHAWGADAFADVRAATRYHGEIATDALKLRRYTQCELLAQAWEKGANMAAPAPPGVGQLCSEATVR